MVVHFPVALLIIATLFKLISTVKPDLTWARSYLVLLIIGVAGAWVAVYTGNLADGEVSRTLCDPTILKDHENSSYATAWIFSAALILSFLEKTVAKLKVVFLPLLIAGSGFLFYTGHLGASLVYQQAAGVHTPDEDCSDFE